MCDPALALKRARDARYRASHREALRVAAMLRYHSNVEAISEQKKAHYEANKPSVTERQKAYYEENRHAAIRRARERRQDMTVRIPAWANMSAIKEIYKSARKSGLTVDHIIPLRGKLVSGLHVHNNLQLLPAGENSSKCNRFVITA